MEGRHHLRRFSFLGLCGHIPARHKHLDRGAKKWKLHSAPHQGHDTAPLLSIIQPPVSWGGCLKDPRLLQMLWRLETTKYSPSRCPAAFLSLCSISINRSHLLKGLELRPCPLERVQHYALSFANTSNYVLDLYNFSQLRSRPLINYDIILIYSSWTALEWKGAWNRLESFLLFC